ncbi:MAG: GDP-mannose 4,6-dehydratase [Chloroflexi bacterium]|nr:GDP-mannose 4,6-dehydratase [Chloroflexota bacterium]MBK6711887.1 GDP-mannose 4,6-dehydratase [Chloroflexota bacterium]MBK7178037.1 GDP-mannose 4,6-dehydratase [Chloroflexota bacterium]MBK7919477.1 GDP-mannose 4,6-dehydratase [Chloroflexota bacterium]MBK8931709.1 GDP-mannose 4,6-dehydratase [Chloroflexota bacterium]
MSLNDNFWQDKHVFVTGCSGLLGSWLTAELVTRGARVIGLVRDRLGDTHLARTGASKQIDVVRGNVTDYELMERTMADYEIDTVFHLAAQTQVGTANRVPMPTFETNIKGTWIILEAARRNPSVQRLVMASSDKAYGTHDSLPYREDTPLQGQHPYDVSKSCADLISRTYAHTYGLPVTVTRCANLYGGGDLNWNRIVPGTIRSVLRGEQPIIRSDGTMRRDYIFIKDVVGGYLRVAEAMHRPDVAGQAFNFGIDNPVSVLEMVQAIIQLSGKAAIKPIILDEVQNEIQNQFLCSEKARQVLGWEPVYDLEAGLRETVDWYRGFLALE